MKKAQLQVVIETVARRLDTANQLLVHLQGEVPQKWDGNLILDAAQESVEVAGALLDDAVGGKAVGSLGRWLYGPGFRP